MFSPKDIQNAGALTLSEEEPIKLVPGDMQGQWEAIENLRLQKDGPYPYWKLRGGLTQAFDFGADILRTYGFEARIGADIIPYIALHLGNGIIKIYNDTTGNVDFTIGGFGGDEPVQFHSAGKLLYVFGKDNSGVDASKYINLKSEVISDYGALDSTPIKAQEDLTAADVQNTFGYQVGDRVVVYPPNLANFEKKGVTYEASYLDLRKDRDGNLIDPGGHPDGTYTEEEANAKVWPTSDDIEENLTLTFRPGIIYATKANEETVGHVYNAFYGGVNYGKAGTDGYKYFSVDTVTRLNFRDVQGDITVPDLKYIPSDKISPDTDFFTIRYGTAAEVDGKKVVLLEGSQSVSAEPDSIWYIIGYDDSLASLLGQDAYDVIESTHDDSVQGDTDFTSYTYLGRPGQGQDATYSRQYVIVDVLDDGSVCIPGKPLVFMRPPRSETIGVKLDVNMPAGNVGKRFLCASRYLPTQEEAFKPISDEYENSPLFIVRDVDTTSTEVYDFSDNKALIRPITELLPMSAGIPAIFGAGQIAPHNITTFDRTIGIAGYSIKRPLPAVYDDFSNTGNVYLEQAGTATGNTGTLFFEYTDGTYSHKETFPLFDTDNTLTIHSLNGLVSTVHVYVDDGTTEYKVDSYKPDDGEFVGLPFSIATDFTALQQTNIPTGLDVVEEINLSDYVTIPIPAQNVQIASQARVFGNHSITGMVPLDFDPDRKPLRYRMQVFTKQNIQIGYITEVQQGSIISYNANFEIADQSRRAKKRKSINRIGRSVFFQDDKGVYVSSGNSIDLVIDKYQYPEAGGDLTDVVFNEQQNEIWFLFGGEVILILDVDSGTVRRFVFPDHTLYAGHYFQNRLLLNSGSILCVGGEGTSDLGSTITGRAISKYFGGGAAKTELREVRVFGRSSSARLQVDDQPQRDRYANGFDGFRFSAQKAFGPQAVGPGGTVFRPLMVGSRLRIGIELSGTDSMIEELVIKYITTKRQM